MKSNKRYLRLEKTLLRYNVKTKKLQYVGRTPTIPELVYASQIMQT